MSESANGTGAAPAPSPGPQPSGADIKPAAVAPLGQSPRLREGISLEEAVKRVGESRRGGERPPRHAAPAEAPADPIDGLINAYRQRNAPPGAPNGADPAPGANGAPPPPNGQE